MANAVAWLGDLEITNGIVGWWKFNEGSGTTTADSSGNGNTGTLTGGSPPVWGTPPGGLQFGNNVSYVDIGSGSVPSALRLVSAGTFCNWFYCTSVANQSCMIAVGVDDSTFLHGYGSDISAGNSFFYFGNDTTDGSITFVPTTFSLNTWYHFACTWNGVNMFEYLNGSQIKQRSQNITMNWNTIASCRIGNSSSGFIPFLGNLDDVRIYNRALSGTELTVLYNRGPQ